MIAKKHSYKSIYQLSKFGSLFLAALFILLSLFSIFWLIRDVVTGVSIDFSFIKTFVNYLFWAGIWSPAVFIWMAYFFTDIETDNKGLQIKFLWLTYSIKWNEVEAVEPFRPLNLFTRKNTSVILVKKNLTFIHRLYGLVYGNTFKPAILIFNNISDYDLLLKNVSVAARKNKGSK